MDSKIQTIALSSLNAADGTYRITTNDHIDVLADTISKVGFINPPILKKRGEVLSIISGFRRVEACRKLNWSHIEARIVENDADDLLCATIAIVENAQQRPLNLIEISRSIRLLSRFFPDIKELSRYASILGLPENPAYVEKLQHLYFLPEAVQGAILSDTISLSMALELGRYSSIESALFIDLFKSLKLSLNKQREIVTLVREIAFRESKPTQKVLTEKDMQDILDDSDLDITQKTRRIRAYLRQKRFPTISQAEKTFKKQVRQLETGKGIRLIPPQHFEGTIYTIQLQFKNIDEIRAQRIELERMINNPALKAILK